jgi:hypothetical protein
LPGRSKKGEVVAGPADGLGDVGEAEQCPPRDHIFSLWLNSVAEEVALVGHDDELHPVAGAELWSSTRA